MNFIQRGVNDHLRDAISIYTVDVSSCRPAQLAISPINTSAAYPAINYL